MGLTLYKGSSILIYFVALARYRKSYTRWTHHIALCIKSLIFKYFSGFSANAIWLKRVRILVGDDYPAEAYGLSIQFDNQFRLC